MRWLNLAGFHTALLAVLAVSSVGFAQPPFGGPHRGGGPDRFIEEHAERLGLDDETREAIEKIVDESRAQARELHRDLRGLHREMHELLSQESPDEAAVMELAEAIGRAETEMHKHRLGTLIKVRTLLTEEQRAELIRIREETRAQWLQPLIEACEDDVDAFCPDREGRWSRRRCLRENWAELSEGCRNALESARGGGRHDHGMPGTGGMGEF